MAEAVSVVQNDSIQQGIGAELEMPELRLERERVGRWSKGQTGMTQRHQEHLERLNFTFQLLNAAKYRKGQEEHGGNLWEMPKPVKMINLLFELLDAVNYHLGALEDEGITHDDILSLLHR